MALRNRDATIRVRIPSRSLPLRRRIREAWRLLKGDGYLVNMKRCYSCTVHGTCVTIAERKP